MRGWLGMVLLVAASSGGAGAEESPQSLAEEVEAAFSAADAERLAAVAVRDPLLVWLVGDLLCTRGAHDAAAALARASARPDVERLRAYVASRRKAPENEVPREAMRAAAAAATAEEARVAVERLLRATVEGDDFLLARMHDLRGALLRALERPREAAQSFLEAGEAAERVGCLALATRAFESSGHRAHDTLDFSGMLKAWTRWQAVERARRDSRGLARSATSVGNAYGELGMYERAIEQYAVAGRVWRRAAQGAELRFVLRNGAVAHLMRGDYPRAQADLEEALDLARAARDEGAISELRLHLAEVHISTGAYEEARILLEAARTHFEASDRAEAPLYVAASLGNLGRVHGASGDFARALDHYGRALAIYRAAGDAQRVTASLLNIAWLHQAAGDLDEALPASREALAHTRAVGDPYAEASTTQNLALMLVERGAYEEAARLQRESILAAERLGSARLLADGYGGLAVTQVRRRRYAEAVRSARTSIGHQETLLAGLADEQGARARARRAQVFEDGARAARASGDLPALAWFLERGRAGSLREGLGSRNALEAATLPPALRQALAAARLAEQGALAAHRQALQSGRREAERLTRGALEAAQGNVAAATARIQREAKAAAALTFPDADSLEVIRGYLGAGDALVLYALTDGDAFALVVEPASARVVSLADSREIDDEAARWLHLGGRPGSRGLDTSPASPQVDTAQATATLRKLLVEPLSLPDTVERVLISPVATLGYVPFALLLPDREVAYVPSGTTYGLLRAKAASRGRSILAVGDPYYEPVACAPGECRQRGHVHLTSLPATRKEVKAVGHVTLLAKAATERGVTEALRRRKQWRAVHFACHGLVDAGRPMRSSLALTADDESDGLLTCLDVFGMRIRTDLVVLSACETGRGKIYKTEGIVGLTRAFMFAGAPRVICSLWKVDDEATRALMIRFYELWNPEGVEGRKPMGAAAALRQAQAFVRSHDEWKHPYYWAAWVLWGLPD